MQSKTLSFNTTLFRKNLTRFWPLWGLASFLGSLFPLAMLVDLLGRGGGMFGREGVTPLTFTEMYYIAVSYAVPIISLCYAILCAMMVWSYLYSARSVGLLHTLPIGRAGLFLTNFLSGMAMMLIPYAVTGTLCVVISLLYGAFDPTGLLVTILGVLGQSFFYFASATFVAFLTGNVFALPALYFLLHFLAPLTDWLVCGLARNFIFGLNSTYSGVADFLSPTMYLVQTLRPDRTWEEVERVAEDGYHYTDQLLTSIRLDGFWVIGVYALAGAALLALAYALYRRRKSETAGDVVSHRWLRPVFRFGITALAALLGGIVLYEIFWSNFQDGRYYDVLPMLACMLIAGLIGFYAASMLLEKSLKVFRGSWKGLILMAAGVAAVCGVLHFDAFGVGSRVPGIGEVTQVNLSAADNSYTFYPGEEDELLEQVRALHQSILAEEDYIRRMDADDWRHEMADGDGVTYEHLYIRYHLKSGKTVSRWYPIPLTQKRMAQEGTYDFALNALVNSEAMKLKRLHAGDDRYVPDGGSLYSEHRSEGWDLSSREAAAILEALGRDAASGAWGDYNWFNRDRADQYAVSLDLSFGFPETEDGVRGGHQDWISITLRPGMTETIRCLMELDLLNENDLVTYRELFPEEYGPYEEAVADGRVPTGVETAYEHTSIGGADGPTEVFVTSAVTSAG